MITDVPGASEYFKGGVVAYSNESKVCLLGVSQGTLDAHGAVSAETAKEMAEGARKVFSSDFAVSITGIAGPGGAAPGKPVGLVFIAVTDGKKTMVERNEFIGDRHEIRKKTADKAMSMLNMAVGGKWKGI